MISNLQMLRGIAATMIVGVHLRQMLAPAGVDGASLPMLFAGVDIFFVISGFIMVHVTARGDVSAGTFLINRAIRIIPVYWLFTLIVFVVAHGLPELGTMRPGPVELATSLAFIPYGEAPLVYVGWTLNLEMYFYLLFAAGIASGRTNGMRLVLTGALIALPVAVANVAAPGSLWHSYGSPLVLEFAIGMAIGHWQARIERLPRWLAIGLVLVGAALLPVTPLFFPQTGTFERFALPAALLVAGLVACEACGLRSGGRMVREWGAISFVLYVAHPLVISAFNNVQERVVSLQTPTGSVVLAGVAAGAALAFAWLVHHGFEKPVARYLRLLTSPRLRTVPL